MMRGGRSPCGWLAWAGGGEDERSADKEGSEVCNRGREVDRWTVAAAAQALPCVAFRRTTG